MKKVVKESLNYEIELEVGTIYNAKVVEPDFPEDEDFTILVLDVNPNVTLYGLLEPEYYMKQSPENVNKALELFKNIKTTADIDEAFDQIYKMNEDLYEDIVVYTWEKGTKWETTLGFEIRFESEA